MWADTDEAIDRLASSFREPLAGAFLATAQARLSDSAPRRGIGWIKLPKWLRAWLQRKALRAELHQLSPRTLADLGISRADFPAIIAGTFTWDRGASQTRTTPGAAPPRS
jgi:uncharacterized protein YjiS (DUF1127 family)